MPYYALVLFDHPPHRMELRDQIRSRHRAYVKANDDKIRFGGSFTDGNGNQRGAVMIFEADNAQVVWDWIDNEPWNQGGVLGDVRVLEWDFARNLLPHKDWHF